MNRRESRISAFCLLFETDFHPDCTYLEIYDRAKQIDELDLSGFTHDLYFTCAEHMRDIDEQIEAASNKWKVSRFSAVARALTRLAVGEIMYTETPPKAVINEIVEISKIYDDEKATSFINGVINNIARHLGKISDEEAK